MFVIEYESPAFRYLADAFNNQDSRKVSIDVRADGIAVKIGEGMWTATMETIIPHVSAWADGFGLWHAEVRSQSERQALRLATERIADELAQRAPRGATPHFSLRLVDQGAVTYHYTENDAS